VSTPPDLYLEVHGAKKRARTLQGRPDPYSTGHYSDLGEPGEQKTFSKDEPSSLASLFPGEGPGLQRIIVALPAASKRVGSRFKGVCRSTGEAVCSVLSFYGAARSRM
jgi:hypothetical protein